MKPLLLLAALCLTSCATTKDQRRVERYYSAHPEAKRPPELATKNKAGSSENLASPPQNIPSSVEKGTKPDLLSGTVRIEPRQTWFDKVLHRPAPPAYTVPAAAITSIGKKATIYYGPATITTVGKKATAATAEGATATVIGKKAGPSITASDSTSLNALSGGGNLAAVSGDGNTVGQTKQDVTKEAMDWKATLASPIGRVAAGAAGLVLLAAAGYGLYLLIPYLQRRKAAKALV